MGLNGKPKKPYSVIRVDTSNALANANASDETSESDSEDEANKEPDKGFEMVEAEPVEGDQEDVGKGVAHKNDKIGSTVFRGVIKKVSHYSPHTSDPRLDPENFRPAAHGIVHSATIS